MTNRIAHGCFTWDGHERRSQRYGSFVLDKKTYEGEIVTTLQFDLDRLMALEGKRVRIVAKVLAARESGHIGDMFLNIKPSQPEVDEEVLLGVGFLELGRCSWNESPEIGLRPNDGRETFWYNPRSLYRLHDQTVDIFIEETTEDFSPVPDFGKSKPGVIANGDGSFQSVGVTAEEAVDIVSENLTLNVHGEGLFSFSPPPPGARLRKRS